MLTIPNFTPYSYQVIKELGHNSEGGRFTYLAQRLADKRQVVIKQFKFAKGSGWDGFGAIEKEIKSLQGLDHRGIPKYLEKFETPDSFCIVTEYFAAETLAVARSFTPEQIKSIAVQMLEILVYLQERIPPVIHRDIKPENILVGKDLNVYLIDFGFARVGGGSVAISSVGAGTFGFMAPEQIRNLQLSKASDLYGLGLTLICLIGAIRSIDIGNYVDYSNQLDRSRIDPKLKGCSLAFVRWLDRMVAPDLNKRYGSAADALEALRGLYITRQPEIALDKPVLEFAATRLGQKLSQTVTFQNSISDTVLEGKWEFLLHRNDGPHSPYNHAWISIEPKSLKDDQQIYCITVDTSKLKAEKNYSRKLVFQNNSSVSSYPVEVRVKTAQIPEQSPIKVEKLLWLFVAIIISLVCIFFSTGFASSTALGIGSGGFMNGAFNADLQEKAKAESTKVYGIPEWHEVFINYEKFSARQSFIGSRVKELATEAFIEHKNIYSTQLILGAFFGNLAAAAVSFLVWRRNKTGDTYSIYMWLFASSIFSILFSTFIPPCAYLAWALFLCPIATELGFSILEIYFMVNYDVKNDIYYALVAFALGFTFWSEHILGFANPFVIAGFVIIGGLVAYKLLLIPLNNRKKLKDYCKNEQYLIDP
jgi:serine/threonine protein kinase